MSMIGIDMGCKKVYTKKECTMDAIMGICIYNMFNFFGQRKTGRDFLCH